MYMATKEMKINGQKLKRGKKLTVKNMDDLGIRRIQQLIRTGHLMELDPIEVKPNKSNKDDKEVKEEVKKDINVSS